MRAKYLIAAALLGLPGLATAADIVMQLGNDVAPASIQAQANELFAAEVAKRDVGIEIRVFHTNQLGTGVQQIQNVKLGVQEMVNTGYELFDVFAPGLKIGSAPFTFVDRTHFENWVRSPMFDAIQQDLISNGNMRFINMGVIWRRGPYRVMIAKHPILNLDELSRPSSGCGRRSPSSGSGARADWAPPLSFYRSPMSTWGCAKAWWTPSTCPWTWWCP